MLVFVDESGDPGLKINKGSAKIFVVTLIVFEDMEEAHVADQRINLLRKELNLHPFFEFKFNKCKKDYRKSFLEALSLYNFFYFSIVIDKSKLYGPGFKFKESFYKYTCSLVFTNAKPYLDKATVIIDGSGSKQFRRQLGTYLRRKINEEGMRHIRKVKLQDSSKNNLLQLADMISGAVYRSFSHKPDSQEYRSIINHREIYIQVWPK